MRLRKGRGRAGESSWHSMCESITCNAPDGLGGESLVEILVWPCVRRRFAIQAVSTVILQPTNTIDKPL